jgi:alpha-galactosidase
LKLSNLIKDHYKSRARINATNDRTHALPGANYVIVSVASNRWDLWEKDYYIPASYGFNQVFGENGGPGGAFHTLRSLNIMIPIAKDVEKYCANALLLNFTNPESRVCLGISKLTNVRAVGLCHGPVETLNIISEILKKPANEIQLTVGGLNHFHWALEIKDKKTGKNLYPDIDKSIESFNWQADNLTLELYKLFGLITYPAPSHPGEYLGFAHSTAGPHFVYWGIGKVSRGLNTKESDLNFVYEWQNNRPSYELWSMGQVDRIEKVIEGKNLLTDKDPMFDSTLIDPTIEIAVPIICDIEFNRDRMEISANVVNNNFAVSNLPKDAIVEVPILVNSNGIEPVKVGPLPEAIKGLCEIQISIQNLIVDAYKEKSKKFLLQALIIDPIVDNLKRAKEMMDTMLRIEKEFLPELE